MNKSLEVTRLHAARWAALVLNWNRKQQTLECLESLFGQTRPPDEIVVVDQHSTDGSPEAIARAFPQVKQVVLDRNIGVAAGRNLLVKLATAELLVFVDNDAELAPDALEQLEAGFQAHPEAAVLTLRVDNYYTGALDEPSWVFPVNMLENADEPFEAVVFAGGACALRRSVFLAAGGYPEDYFFSGEEEALAFELLERGYSLWYWPKARLLHKVSPDRRFSWGRTRYYYYVRNRLTTYLKYVPAWALPQRLLVHTLGHGFQAARNGLLDQFLPALWQLLRRAPALLSVRNPVSARTWQRYVRLEAATRGSVWKRIVKELLRKRL